MKKQVNDVRISGYLYEYDLKEGTTGPNSKNPGTEYVRGWIGIATDEKLTNVLRVHYSFVSTHWGGNPDNKKDTRYPELLAILNGEKPTVLSGGKETAAKISITGAAFAPNDFYVKDKTTGEDTLVTQIRPEGGFISYLPELPADENDRNVFMTDMVITKTDRIEADEEKQTQERLKVSGLIFSYRNEVIPVSFNTFHPKAMEYFEAANPSRDEPLYTKIWGRQESVVTITKTVEETAFGDDYVVERPSTFKSLTITRASKDPYVWDDEHTITAEELNTKRQERTLYLAKVKSDAEAYAASKQAEAATPKKPVTTAVSDDDFDF